MRGLLLGVGIVLISTATALPAQRAPMSFLAPADRDLFLESWYGSELRSAGLKPLWTERGLEGYQARYRLLFASGSKGVTIVTIDVETDGSAVVVATRKRPGGIVEENERARYIPGRVAWSDRYEMGAGAVKRLGRMFAAQDFFNRSFRADDVAVEPEKCTDGVSYLVEVRDRKGYNAITRDNCDVHDVRGLIDAVMKVAGGWPRR